MSVAPLRVLAVLSAVLLCGVARAQTTPPASRTMEFRFTPTARAQIALWIEKADGTFLKTVGLTQAISYRGIGNRPGAAQMNSGFRWPYGRREGVLPIWAHRRVSAPGAMPFRRVIFQDRASEGFASRTSNDSTADAYFCLSFAQASTPELRRQEAMDAVTCASRFMSDKGRFLTDSDRPYPEPAVVAGQAVTRPLELTSLYPPRRDVKPCGDGPCAPDTTDVAEFDPHARTVMPDIDAITMATPPADVEQAIMFTVPAEWANGDYVAWLEVNVEGDYNAAFNDRTLPTPMEPMAMWDSWAIGSGYPYRGQPSVVFQAPFKLGPPGNTAVSKPSFYGDVDGFGPGGGALHPMDGQISDDPAGAPGKGADRLRLVAPSGQRFQVAVQGTEFCGAHEPPGAPEELEALVLTGDKHSHEWGELRLKAPNSDVAIVQYQVRFSTNPILEVDPATFERALPAVAAKIETEALMVPIPETPGTAIDVEFGGMEPLTRYYVAVRAVDRCNVAGPYRVAELTTTGITFTKLSGCFVATAAYGSALEPSVEALRQARDALRPRSSLFSIATDLYYRSGPAAAAIIARSDVARATVRTLLAPVVALAGAAYPPRARGTHARGVTAPATANAKAPATANHEGPAPDGHVTFSR